jgi:hypothetical protein
MKGKKRDRRHIYMRKRLLVDPRTGEEVPALVPSSMTDRRILNARKFPIDGRVRVEVRNPRNEGFHRLVHAFGTFLVMYVEGYGEYLTARGKPDSHAAVKACQALSGAACDIETLDVEIPGHGMTQVRRYVPRSISFDELDEDEFSTAFKVMTDYVAANDYPGMLPEQIADFEALIEGDQ